MAWTPCRPTPSLTAENAGKLPSTAYIRNMRGKPSSFRAFWPHYLMAHRDPRCRALHYVGSTGGLIGIVAAILSANGWWILAGLAFAYIFAWIGHFLVERNRPATFGNPLWSLIGDIRMYLLWLGGGLERAMRAAELQLQASSGRNRE
jgi:hypothetical protein